MNNFSFIPELFSAKKSFIICCFFVAAFFTKGIAQKENAYFFSVDLNEVKDDQLRVNLLVPKIKAKTIVYNIPKIVPGTYSISDFGRFITDFKAYDKKGKELVVNKLDENRWEIQKSNKLKRISYWVEDTWDTEKGNFIFEPAGTNIEEKKSFVINTFGFFGYFDDMKLIPYKLTFEKPEDFYGSTALIAEKSEPGFDTYSIDSYVDLADSPIMYNVPDTTILKVGGADVLVSVYSPNQKLTSEYVGENIAEILEAQRKYLGGTLPIKKYAFIIYLTDKPSKSGMMGALEHSYSSLYFLPEIDPKYLTQSIRDIAAHEFFHIVTPLNIHSEEIQYFDFIEPKMSKHLWMYEGVTEYFANHVQVSYGLLPPEEFIETIRTKLNQASAFNDTVPFTIMSEQVLGKYEDQYGNVYEKGALIGLCLDIRLRELSEGKYGLRNMMLDLSKVYGKSKAFKDDELFDKIVEITGFPEIRAFFTKYVEGSEPLPLKEYFAKVGFIYKEEAKINEISMGNILSGLALDKDSNFVLQEVENLDDFGKKMGYQQGDIITKINGDTLTLETARELLMGFPAEAKAGDTLTVEVLRLKEPMEEDEEETNENGEKVLVVLQEPVEVTEKTEYHIFEGMENPTEEQIKVLRSWLFAEEEE
ncbi:hypothetical protein [Flexithrix dorotheae]|uniref:M61 family metallopeptidase n=1 Tax=Flexithrix dorotheae TaxID=70993 RepID=UPI000365E1B8|nr:hypothetical protein [Flexithrix dorotheae]